MLVKVAIYFTELALPVMGRAHETVASEVMAELERDLRIEAVDARARHPGLERGVDDHVRFAVHFTAPSQRIAEAFAKELQEAALRPILNAAEKTGRDYGFTVGLTRPERVRD